MREITYNIYKYEELSDAAKAVAVEKMRGSVGDTLCEFDADEYRDTLEQIERIFEIKVYRWEVGCCSTSYRWRFVDNCRWPGVCTSGPKFLLRYINELRGVLLKGKYYSTPGTYVGGRYCYKSRRGKTVFDDFCCCLTGKWCDFAVDDAMKACYEYVRRGADIEDFIEDVLGKFFNQWNEDVEHCYSDEEVIDHIEANEFEFFEDGRPFS